MRVADLRAGDLFIFDGELGECCAVVDAHVDGAGSWCALTYDVDDRREVALFDPRDEVELTKRAQVSTAMTRSQIERNKDKKDDRRIVYSSTVEPR